jgi:hypothetical protein
MSRILHLTLTKKWFDMIACGEKQEEYREMKPFWYNRFVNSYDNDTGEYLMKYGAEGDIVVFTNGYGVNRPQIEIELIEIRIAKNGNPNWGFTQKCFGIKLGKILSIKNYNQ